MMSRIPWAYAGRRVLAAIPTMLAIITVSVIASLVTGWLQTDLVEDLEEVTQDMTANVRNPVGAVTLGLSAGIGEELLLRGSG